MSQGHMTGSQGQAMRRLNQSEHTVCYLDPFSFSTLLCLISSQLQNSLITHRSWWTTMSSMPSPYLRWDWRTHKQVRRAHTENPQTQTQRKQKSYSARHINSGLDKHNRHKRVTPWNNPPSPASLHLSTHKHRDKSIQWETLFFFSHLKSQLQDQS